MYMYIYTHISVLGGRCFPVGSEAWTIIRPPNDQCHYFQITKLPYPFRTVGLWEIAQVMFHKQALKLLGKELS